MARNDAKEVERQYYEFRQRMEQKRANAPAPAQPSKKAASASRKAPVTPAKKPTPPKAEEHKPTPVRPVIPQKTPVEPERPVQPIADTPAEPVYQPAVEVAELPVEDESIEAIETPELPVTDGESEAIDDELLDEDDPEEIDEEATYEDDGEELDEEADAADEEDAAQGGVMDAVLGAGSKLLSGLGGFAASLGGRLRSLRRDKTEDDEEDAEIADGDADYAEEASGEDLSEAPDETPVEDIEDAYEAELSEEFDEGTASDETICEVAATDDPADADPDVADEEETLTEDVPSDLPMEDLLPEEVEGDPFELTDEDLPDEESDEESDENEEDDEDDEEESAGFLSRLFGRLKQLKPLKKDEEEDEILYEEDPAANEDLSEPEDELPPDDEEEFAADETDDSGFAGEEAEAIFDADEGDFGETDDEYEDDEYEDLADDLESPEPIHEDTSTMQDANDQEGDIDTMDNNNEKSMTQLMSEGMSDTPTLSRRERRMLAEATEAKKQITKTTDDLDLLDEVEEDKDPTQEYKPVRAKKEEPAPIVRKPVVALDDDDEDDEDDEEEEEVKPARKKLLKLTKKRPVYDEDEDDEDDEDEEEEVKPARKKPVKPEKKRPAYEDEDDEDDFDDDDEYDDEDDDDDEEVSFGHRCLGFLKGLFALILLLLVLVVALQVAEKGGYLSLNWLREKVGSSVPFINTIFPEPAVQADGMPTEANN